MTKNTNKPYFIAKERERWINRHTNEPAINYHCVICNGITSEKFLKNAYEKKHPVDPYRLCNCESCDMITVSELC